MPMPLGMPTAAVRRLRLPLADTSDRLLAALRARQESLAAAQAAALRKVPSNFGGMYQVGDDNAQLVHNPLTGAL